jgi:Ca-activated chloride channel family protein
MKRLTALSPVSLVSFAAMSLVLACLPSCGMMHMSSRAPMPPMSGPLPTADGEPSPEMNTEAYARIDEVPFQDARSAPLSTFSLDVDTASYANVRRFLAEGIRPPKDAVRIEELVNYFPYDYAQPANGEPFAADIELASCPWAPQHRLARVGLRTPALAAKARPPANLVFLLDVSGSMMAPNKLPLVKRSLALLLRQMTEQDRVAIAVYAGNSGLVLPSTPGDRRADILAALERLEAGGSTNGGAGIDLAYDTARAGFVKGGINRVILATDGDFNVGTTSEGALTRLIEDEAASGVFLTVLGFGMGNLKDSTMEQLADRGNGNYAYIDTLSEAKKVLVDQMAGTLVTVAKDVKLQVEFNPSRVGAYRLIGYENRMLAARDFNDDDKDAGDVGAGTTVTAIYELVPAGGPAVAGVDPLKYQQSELATTADTDELFTLKLRYKEPDGKTSRLIETAVRDSGAGFEAASTDLRFAVAVAAFGMVLRESKFVGGSTLGMVSEWASAALGADAQGYRREFVDLVRRAQSLPR